ncbi:MULTISPECIES: carbohydrate-binding protein [unclassified Paenibacillus]
MTYNGKTYKCLQAHTPLPGGSHPIYLHCGRFNS